MSDLSPIPALPPAPPAQTPQPGWWSRLIHRRAAREARAAREQARLLAAHHAWTTERARRAQIDIVLAGYHLGPVPYGYLPLRVGPAKQRRVRLVVDPGPASVVAAIYHWRIDDRLTPTAITTRLRGLAHPTLAPIDPTTGFPRPWTSGTVARILANPVYTGAAVWGRTQAGRPVPPDLWIIRPGAHQPIIDGRTFHHVQLLAPRGAGIFSAQLPPWEFPRDQSADSGGGSSSDRPIA